jgi:hypothetical protein
MNRRQEIKNQTSTSVLLSQFDYTYDPEGQITTWTKSNPSLSANQRFDLGYDNADQLLTAPLKDASTNALITNTPTPTPTTQPQTAARSWLLRPRQSQRPIM